MWQHITNKSLKLNLNQPLSPIKTHINLNPQSLQLKTDVIESIQWFTANGSTVEQSLSAKLQRGCWKPLERSLIATRVISSHAERGRGLTRLLPIDLQSLFFPSSFKNKKKEATPKKTKTEKLWTILAPMMRPKLSYHWEIHLFFCVDLIIWSI